MGKTKSVTTVLETFPEDNVLVLTEASPKSIYYFARNSPERLKNLIIYLDDARPEHIPVLKSFRNESNVTPSNLTVGDRRESVLLHVPHRPVIIASAVNPVRDMEQQASSRAFLMSIPDTTPEEEARVRKAIRLRGRAGGILKKKSNERRDILRAMSWILREEGVKSVLVPFEAAEPAGADRRGAGQFQRLVRISAFINQFQRPILEQTDGQKFVLAVYEDLETAATVWFDFAAGQEFKISAKAIDTLRKLPTKSPGITSADLADAAVTSQRTIERYLNDLYEAGLVYREKMKAPGSPWGYWCSKIERQNVLSRISASEGNALYSDRFPTETLCRKYLAKNASDSLKDSIIEFFSNHDIIDKEMYKGIWKGTELQVGTPEEIYLTLFPLKPCRDSENAPSDSE